MASGQCGIRLCARVEDRGPNLGSYADRVCAQNGSLAVLLSENDDAHTGGFRVGRCRKMEGNRAGVEFFDCTDALKDAEAARMLEMMAAVLAAANVGRVEGVDQGSVECGLRLRGGRSGNGDRGRDLAPVNHKLGELKRN